MFTSDKFTARINRSCEGRRLIESVRLTVGCSFADHPTFYASIYWRACSLQRTANLRTAVGRTGVKLGVGVGWGGAPRIMTYTKRMRHAPNAIVSPRMTGAAGLIVNCLHTGVRKMRPPAAAATSAARLYARHRASASPTREFFCYLHCTAVRGQKKKWRDIRVQVIKQSSLIVC